MSTQMSGNWIRCLCLLVLVLLVLTEAKFGRHKKADRNGRVHFHGRQSQGSRSLDLNYNATLKVNPDDVIDLDDIRPASVECYSSSVVVVFTDASVSNSFRDVNETKSPLNWRAGDIIVGGSEYGCAMDNAPHDLMRRIIRLTRFNSRYVLQTVTVDLKDVFSELNGTLEVIRTEITRQDLEFPSRDMSNPQEVFALPAANSTRRKRATTDVITVISPAKRASFLTPEVLPISFQATFTGSVVVYFYIDDYFSDTKVYTSPVLSVVAGQVTSLNVTITGDFPSSTYYYLSFKQGSSFIFDSEYFSINYAENGYFSSPAPSSEYASGDYINVVFKLPESFSSVTVTLYRNINNGVDDYYFERTISVVEDVTNNISIPVYSDWPESNNYYIYLEWSCSYGFFCESASSEYFTIRKNRAKSSITFSSPLSTDVYTTGQQIRLEWYSDVYITNSTIYVKQERAGPDPTRYTVDFAPFSNGSRYFNIPVGSWTPSSNYYVEMRYNCKSEEFCNIVQTARFSVASSRKVSFISPPAKKRYAIGDVILLDLDTTLTNAQVSIVADYPIYVPFLSPLWQAQMNPQQTRSITVTSDLTSSFPVHVEVAYNCVYDNYFCIIERGPQFYITQTFSGNFNYNQLTGKANTTYNIFHKNCTTLGFPINSTCQDDTFYAPVCEFCSAGGLLDINLDCDNCWVKTEVTLSVITFSLTSVTVEFDSDFDLNLDFLLTVQGKYQNEGTIKLTPKAIDIFGFEVNLYLFTARLGLVSNCYINYNYTVEATGTVAMGFDISVPVHLKIDTEGPSSFDPDLNFHRHGPEIKVQGNVTGRAELVFELILSAFQILEFTGRFIPYTTLEGQFQIPPFEAMNPPGYLIENSTYHVGDCTIAHLVEYEIDVGFDTEFVVSVLATQVFDKRWNTVPPFPFVSGCLLQIYRFETMCFEFNTVPAQIGLSKESFSAFFIGDLIAGVDSRLSTDQFFTLSFDIDVSTTEICFFVVEMNGMTVEQIASEIADQISNDNSRVFDTRLSRVSPYLIRPAAPVPVIPPLADTPVLPPFIDSPVTPPIDEPVSIPITTPEAGTPISVPVQYEPVSFDPPTVAPSILDAPIAVPINDQVPVGTDTPLTVPVAEPSITPIESPIEAPISDQYSPVVAPQTINEPLSESPATSPMTESSPIATPLTAPVPVLEPMSSPIDVPISAPTVTDDTPVAAPDVQPIASPITDSTPIRLDSPTAVPSSDAPISNEPITVPISSPVPAPVGNQPVYVPVTQPTSVPIMQSTPVPVTNPPVQSPVRGPIPISDNVPIVQVPPVASNSPLSGNQSPNSAPKVEDAKGQISRGTSLYASTLMYAVLVIVANWL